MANPSHKLGSNIPLPSATKLPDRVRIVLEDSDKIPPTGQYFGLNGKGFILRAGEAADVPRGIVDILDNAVESAPIKDGSDRIVGSRNRHRFPYRILRDAEEA